MATKIAAKSVRVYLDKYNLSGDLNATDQAFNVETPLVTCFSNEGPRRVEGNYDTEDNDLGFFDGDAGAHDAILAAIVGDGIDHYLGKLFGTTEGDTAYEKIVRIDGQPRSGGLGGAVLLNFSSKGSGGAYRGVILRSATVTGAGNGTGQNLGATVSGDEFAVTFRVLSFTGTNITLKVQESSDDGGGDAYADIASLTSGALTAIGVVRVSTTAATEAWKRLNVSGTFTSALILVTCGTVAGT